MRSDPVVISFYSGDQYYYEAARRLREDCERAGLTHDIVEVEKSPGQDWIAVCRRKVSFIREMHVKHREPVLWLDADSRLVKRPDVLMGASCDFAAFLRGFRYLRGFDPLSLPRYFAPFALYFNKGPRVTAFLDLMARLEREFEAVATDDYFLQEAWDQHEQQLSVMILPPDMVGHEWPLRDEQVIYVGISGNVSSFKALAQQHTAEILDPSRRKAVLLHEAQAARAAGQIDDAIILYRCALSIGPLDDALAEKIARLMQQRAKSLETDAFLAEDPGSTEGKVSMWARLFGRK